MGSGVYSGHYRSDDYGCVMEQCKYEMDSEKK